LGRWADLLLIAPCSVNTIAKLASGFCDNLLTAIYLSANCPIVVAPAMDLEMFSNSITQKNIETLKSIGVHVLEPDNGYLASGSIGKGRLPEPERIVHYAEKVLSEPFLVGKRVLITAGPSREKVDPVRFISNFSTGKMGIALAQEAAYAGAQTILVLGPVSEPVPDLPNLSVISVETAQQFFDEVETVRYEQDILIYAAAIADFRPVEVATQKIKKQPEQDSIVISLTKNPDLLSHAGKHKRKGQLVIGFALETDHEIANAKTKLLQKNADVILLNSLQHTGSGFGTDTNQVTIFFSDGSTIPLPLLPKRDCAKLILKHIYNHFL
ncbi:MAG: bifunctional phosphopantothenoylcysteine decarboxylase/phosphopantothenate--cysteine ligase CoaBC, partial [Bacteroidia bacterium]|nr:bifunctional phosphopantothenoylcysteine decarboxylase/phosphopantothenate--cysteine ligase CoaBC [Bacteroidia bacterium]